MDTANKIHDFFKAYADRLNDALKTGKDDVEGTASAFADCFVGASPSGVFCGYNNADFREQIPKGNQFYRDIGTVSMNVNRIEITQLNSVHFMAKVFWQSAYNVKGATRKIDFHVVYLLQLKDKTLKIFCYVSEDEQKALQEHGIIDPAP